MSDPALKQNNLERLPTGIAGLDVILQGGLFRRGIYLITGDPGTGKTILANQLCFNHVARGERAIYITLFTESHADLLSYLQTMDFFNENVINETLKYYSGHSVLKQSGLDGLLKFLNEIVRDEHPTFVVIDTLLLAELIAPPPDQLREFIEKVHALLQFRNCTAMMLTHIVDETRFYPQRMIIDGLIELKYPLLDNRAVRYIQISKFRGSGFLQGQHLFEITSKGISVYPRTEATLAVPTHSPVALQNRVGFGISMLDEMLEGGLLATSVTGILGTMGSGKTILGSHFLAEGARLGEPSLYMGFYEMPPYMISTADHLGLNFSGHLKDDMLEIIWKSSLTDNIDKLSELLISSVQKRNVKRLFIDGLVGFEESADNPKRLKRFLTAICNELRARQVTTLITLELPNLFSPTLELPYGGLLTIFDNIIMLRLVELHSRLHHLLSITKMRGQNYDRTIREFTISDQGIDVNGIFQNAEDILTGTAKTVRSSTSQRRYLRHSRSK